MSWTFRVAVAAAATLSAVAVFDAVHVGVTGISSSVSDQFGRTPMLVIGDLVHGLTYAALLTVLVVERRRINGGSRVRRWIRRLLVVDFALMASMFLGGALFQSALERYLGEVSSTIGGIAFLLMFVLAVALGIAIVREPQLRTPALVLIGTVPLVGLAIGLGALGSGFAHPAYPEAAVYIGIALLARRAVHMRAPAPAYAPATPR